MPRYAEALHLLQASFPKEGSVFNAQGLRGLSHGQGIESLLSKIAGLGHSMGVGAEEHHLYRDCSEHLFGSQLCEPLRIDMQYLLDYRC